MILNSAVRRVWKVCRFTQKKIHWHFNLILRRVYLGLWNFEEAERNAKYLFAQGIGTPTISHNLLRNTRSLTTICPDQPGELQLGTTLNPRVTSLLCFEVSPKSFQVPHPSDCIAVLTLMRKPTRRGHFTTSAKYSMWVWCWPMFSSSFERKYQTCVCSKKCVSLWYYLACSFTSPSLHVQWGRLLLVISIFSRCPISLW